MSAACCSSALYRFRNPACARRQPDGPTLALFGSEELSDNSIDTSDIDAMLDWMRSYEPAQASKWIDEKRRNALV